MRAHLLAVISTIPKKTSGSKNPKEYRPISVTSCLGKLAERMLRTRLTEFVEENNLIVKY